MTENRPSPDALLEEAQSEEKGRLKIFLGAAPGVGKTYAMLGAARTRIAEGIDTVIGIVETHKRSETEALADGIEIISKQNLDYRGLNFEEMDLDAVLKRKPKLVLVDELAHTNIPGARHPKRYQDVQELIDAGIDVYSTLNVQHIESLNDIVTRITGVTVRETVPDMILQMAHSIELIDLPPEELLQRLKDGKVYIPEQARLAITRFFTAGNLTALRELALRQAADRVDAQMTSYMRRHAIEGPWPTSNRILVCISDDKQATSLVRTARRSAERRQAPWLVLYIETSRHSFLSETARKDIAQAMELAESMGGETLTATGEDIASEVLRVARDRNVSTIMIGKSVRSLWSRLTRPSVAAAILDRGDGFDIMLMNSGDAKKPLGTEAQKNSVPSESLPWTMDWAGYGKTFFIVFIASLVAGGASELIAAAYLPFLYLIAILMVVIDLGATFSAFATLVSGIALDLIMSAPHFTFLPTQREDCVALLFFLIAGLVISAIGDRLHRQIKITQLNAERTQYLYDFTKSMAAAGTIDEVAQAAVSRVASALSARTLVLLPRDEHLEIVASVPPDLHLDTASNAAMDWAWRHGKNAGWRSDTLPGAPFFGLPLKAGQVTIGVLAVRMEKGTALTSAQNHFLVSLGYQTASAIERAKLVSDIAQARLQTETEKLRSNLLSSISHDLRAPLDTILSTITRINTQSQPISAAEQQRLLASIEKDSHRLDRSVQNLLDMTELATGTVKLDKKPTNLKMLIEGAFSHLSRQVVDRPVFFDWAEGLPEIDCDQKALLRVFVNVLENACTYSAASLPLKITGRQEGQDVVVTIQDQGPGIPLSERERIFDMFYRVKNAALAHSVNGAGLGLSISRGFVEAHSGTISARSGDDGTGTKIVIRLPATNGATG